VLNSTVMLLNAQLLNLRISLGTNAKINGLTQARILKGAWHHIIRHIKSHGVQIIVANSKFEKIAIGSSSILFALFSF
jgi:hypothetical protein